jgi:hypothetical protein
VLLSLVWLCAPAVAADLLMLGNSYTDFNDLEVLTADVFEAATGSRPDAVALVAGGLSFVDHQSRIEDSAGGGNWPLALGEKSAAQHAAVVLQEQSQIPGFSSDSGTLADSRAAAIALDAAAVAHGGQTVFFMTWGRREGDSSNSELYPDFLTMQGRLTEGYKNYVDDTSTADRPTFLAPVGLAFQAAYEQTASTGADPLDPDGLFYQLYSSDGSHPSSAGSYLAACVFYATLTGQSPVGLDVGPTEIDASTRAVLQELAASTVFEATPDILYPWQVGAPADTGGGDTAPQSDGGAPSGDGGADSGDGGVNSGDGGAADAEPGEPEDGDRCACGAVGAGGRVWPLLVLLVALARRRPVGAGQLQG